MSRGKKRLSGRAKSRGRGLRVTVQIEAQFADVVERAARSLCGPLEDFVSNAAVQYARIVMNGIGSVPIASEGLNVYLLCTPNLKAFKRILAASHKLGRHPSAFVEMAADMASEYVVQGGTVEVKADPRNTISYLFDETTLQHRKRKTA